MRQCCKDIFLDRNGNKCILETDICPGICAKCYSLQTQNLDMQNYSDSVKCYKIGVRRG